MASWNRLPAEVVQANDAATSLQQLQRASIASLLPLVGSAAIARATWFRHVYMLLLSSCQDLRCI